MESTPAKVPFRERVPWATGGLTALLVGMFVIELIFGVSPSELGSPSVLTLIATGGSMRSLVVDEGEWYRVFTAAFLHAGFIHLLCNGVALVMAGAFLETILGRAWFLALFVVGALGGSALSLAVNPANVVSVGASGAIMALLAAGVVVAFRIPAHHRGKIQGQLLRVLIPSLLPIATMSGDGGSIDYGAHLGGAVVGVLLGWLLLRTWPSPADADLAVRLPAPFPAELADAPDAGPRFRRAAQLLTAGGILLFALGFLFVQRGYPKYVDIAAAAAYADALVPDDQLASLKGSPEAVRALAEKYPRDPRALFMHGAHSIDAGDLAGGKALMRRALADRELLRLVFADRKLEITIRGVLIEVLLSEDDRAQAEAIAAPICQAGPGGTIPETLLLLDVCK